MRPSLEFSEISFTRVTLYNNGHILSYKKAKVNVLIRTDKGKNIIDTWNKNLLLIFIN